MGLVGPTLFDNESVGPAWSRRRSCRDPGRAVLARPAQEALLKTNPDGPDEAPGGVPQRPKIDPPDLSAEVHLALGFSNRIKPRALTPRDPLDGPSRTT